MRTVNSCLLFISTHMIENVVDEMYLKKLVSLCPSTGQTVYGIPMMRLLL